MCNTWCFQGIGWLGGALGTSASPHVLHWCLCALSCAPFRGKTLRIHFNVTPILSGPRSKALSVQIFGAALSYTFFVFMLCFYMWSKALLLPPSSKEGECKKGNTGETAETQLRIAATWPLVLRVCVCSTVSGKKAGLKGSKTRTRSTSYYTEQISRISGSEQMRCPSAERRGL